MEANYCCTKVVESTQSLAKMVGADSLDEVLNMSVKEFIANYGPCELRFSAKTVVEIEPEPQPAIIQPDAVTIWPEEDENKAKPVYKPREPEDKPKVFVIRCKSKNGKDLPMHLLDGGVAWHTNKWAGKRFDTKQEAWEYLSRVKAKPPNMEYGKPWVVEIKE